MENIGKEFNNDEGTLQRCNQCGLFFNPKYIQFVSEFEAKRRTHGFLCKDCDTHNSL